MNWRNQLQDDLNDRDDRHLRRSLRSLDCSDRVVHEQGRELLNFAGNDYLGLARHPRVIEAVQQAAAHYGVGSGASRLVTGHLDLHAEVESRFARFKKAEAALLLPTGYTANLAVLTSLASEDDLICLDKLNHASLIDAAVASGATVRIFPHRHYEKLARLLDRATLENGQPPRRRLIVSDSVFSMDGDCADLRILIEHRDRYEAILILDEAHGTGVLGEHGGGLAEALDVSGQIDVTISTASKALGSLGGIVTGSQLIIDTLVNRARPFIYSTAVPPTQAAAILAGIEVIAHDPGLRERLHAKCVVLREMLASAGWSLPERQVWEPVTPIIPVIVGEASAALALSDQLRDAGLIVPAIRPPTVAPGSSRLRITLRADHSGEDLSRLVATLGQPR